MRGDIREKQLKAGGVIIGNEKIFENKIKKYLRSKGCYVVKFFANSFTKVGVPDLICTVNGYFLAIEVKAQDGHPSELQLHNVEQIRKAGGFAYVVYPSGWERLKAIIDGLLIDKFNREEDVILK